MPTWWTIVIRIVYVCMIKVEEINTIATEWKSQLGLLDWVEQMG